MFGEDEITPIGHALDVCHYGKNKTYMDYTKLVEQVNNISY